MQIPGLTPGRSYQFWVTGGTAAAGFDEIHSASAYSSSLAIPVPAATPYPSVVNIAVGKSTQMSHQLSTAVSGLAVDGNITQILQPGGGASAAYACASTMTYTQTGVFPWWQVDLGSSADIVNVTIYARADGGTNWMDGFVVYISDAGGNNFMTGTMCDLQLMPLGPRAPTFQMSISCGITGRFVTIYLPTQNLPLQLCEVQVRLPPYTIFTIIVLIERRAGDGW